MTGYPREPRGAVITGKTYRERVRTRELVTAFEVTRVVLVIAEGAGVDVVHSRVRRTDRINR